MNIINGLRRALMAGLLAVVSLSFMMVMGGAWLLTTTQGAQIAFKIVKKVYVLPFDILVGNWQGNILNGLTLKEVQLSFVSHLPAEALVRIQDIALKVHGVKLNDIDIDVKNARLFIANSDPIVLQGTWSKARLEANLFARSVDLGKLVKLLPMIKNPSVLTGFVSHVDIVARGDINKMDLLGKLIVDHIEYKTTTVAQGPGDFHLTADFPNWQLFGEASMSDGVVHARRVNVDLMPSKVFFKGDPYNPTLNIHGSSVVDKVSIDLGFRGTLRLPELVLVSDPPLPQDVLIVMLATGRSWAKTAASGRPTTVSGELVSGFFDYLLLGGQGGTFAQTYGLNEATPQYQEEANKIGLKKKVTDDVRVGVEIEKVPSTFHGEQVIYTKKLEGEMDVTEHVSVNLSQKVLPQDSSNTRLIGAASPSEREKNETQIYLKYQNRF